MNLTLSLSDTLLLIHAPAVGSGKTTSMAKGLFLNNRDEMYAGESAGFGLPVWKTGRYTVFPSLVSARLCNPNTIEKVYRLDQLVTWQIFGINVPRLLPAAMERMTELYMQQPAHQQLLLHIRDVLFVSFGIRSSMTPGRSWGECRVLYMTDMQQVTVTVDGHELQEHGELIMLNEVAGLPFGRLRIGTNIQEGNNISAWQSCPFNTVLENPEDGIEFCLTLPTHAESSHWRLAVGREIGRELNWAGLALTANQRQFSYGISFTDTFNHR